MFPLIVGNRNPSRAAWSAWFGGKGLCVALALVLGVVASTQEPGAPPPAATASPASEQPSAPANDSATAPSASNDPATKQKATQEKATKDSASKDKDAPPAAISEEELKQLLVGKPLYLRGGYLDNTLNFSERGALIGHSPQGSYTLSAIQIDHVRLTKHKVELDGARYGLHFLGALPYEDPDKALDRVRITPKKKVVRITIDRELVVMPKKKKEKESDKGKEKGKKGKGAASAVAPEAKEPSEEDQARAEMAAAAPEERPADPASITTTTSQAHANKLLKDALDQIFAPGLDDRMMAAMPDFWKLYYRAVADKTDYRPKDSSVMRQNTVDKKAVLVSRFEPESNEWAQANAVAGMALYHAVIGADGKPGEIAVARPIGFGLDENAVAAIRKASFVPASKDGKAVPVLLDLVVQFRIYSNRTSVTNKPEAAEKPSGPTLPGPYSVQRP